MRGSEFGKAIGESLTRGLGRLAGRLKAEAPVDVDVLESDEEILLVLDAPGADADDVQVRYETGDVVVNIDRRRANRPGYEMQFPGRAMSIQGRATVPRDVAIDADRARARLRDDGTLYVFLPKTTAEGGDEPAEAADDVAIAGGKTGDERTSGTEVEIGGTDEREERDEPDSGDASLDTGGRSAGAAQRDTDDGTGDESADEATDEGSGDPSMDTSGRSGAASELRVERDENEGEDEDDSIDEATDEGSGDPSMDTSGRSAGASERDTDDDADDRQS